MTLIADTQKKAGQVVEMQPEPEQLGPRGATMTLPFEIARELLAGSPPVRRPNRAQPIGAITNAEVASALAAIDEVYTAKVFGPAECEELRKLAADRMSNTPTDPGQKLPLDE